MYIDFCRFDSHGSWQTELRKCQTDQINGCFYLFCMNRHKFIKIMFTSNCCDDIHRKFSKFLASCKVNMSLLKFNILPFTMSLVSELHSRNIWWSRRTATLSNKSWKACGHNTTFSCQCGRHLDFEYEATFMIQPGGGEQAMLD